jgi:hypothetical protein
LLIEQCNAYFALHLSVCYFCQSGYSRFAFLDARTARHNIPRRFKIFGNMLAEFITVHEPVGKGEK